MDKFLNYVDVEMASRMIERAVAFQLKNPLKGWKNIFIHGKPGLGKSQAVREVAEMLGMDLIDLRLAGVDETMVMGLPYVWEGTQYFSTPAWWPSGDKPSILFLDECFDDQTEVLTNRGFILFKDVLADDLVAQFDQNTGTIEFVTPIRTISRRHEGVMVGKKSSLVDFMTTPNHDMLVKNRKTGEIKKVLADDLQVRSDISMFSAGKGVGKKTSLTTLDKFAIAFQSDGCLSHTYCENPPNANIQYYKNKYDMQPTPGNKSVQFAFKKKRKADRFREMFSDLLVREGTYDYEGEIMTHFYVRDVDPTILSKDFTDVFQASDFSCEAAREFLEELSNWDGFRAGNGFGYSNTNKSSIDFVQTLCVLAGYRSTISVADDSRSESYSTCYKVHWYPAKSEITGQALKGIRKDIPYSGMVYCVEMPKGTVVTRRNGRVLITGNCKNAHPQTQVAAFRLILDRTIQNGKKLPDNCVIIAAGNMQSDKTGARELSVAMATRFCMHLVIDPDTTNRTFLNYAVDRGLSRHVIGYLEWRKENTYQEKSDESPIALPRTWEALSDNMLMYAPGEFGTTEFNTMVASTVGTTVGTDFSAYLANVDKLPDWTKVRTDDPDYDYVMPKNEPAVHFGVSTGLAMEMIENLNKNGTVLTGYEKVLGELPREMHIVFFRTLRRSMSTAIRVLQSPEFSGHWGRIKDRVK